LSVGDDFMIDMTVAFSSTATAASGEAAVSRRRGKSKAPNFTYEGHPPGKPGGWSAPWTGTWPATGILICPRA
jgi:hypothetical protein